MKKTIIIATQNLGKLKEFEVALSTFFDDFISLKDLNDHDEVEETGSTYQENAQLKARYFYEKYQLPVIADDSGLEIMNLNRYPGIYSARIGQNDQERRHIILNKLSNISNREAFMVTHLTYIDHNGMYDVESNVKGSISLSQEGNHGFGYDAIFIPEGYIKTFASLHPSEKLKVSHRGQAILKFIEYLKEKKHESNH